MVNRTNPGQNHLLSRHRGRRLKRVVGTIVCYVGIALLTAWSALALSFDLPQLHLRAPAAAVYLLLTGFVIHSFKSNSARFLAALVGCVLVAAWWFTLKPSSDGPWQPDVSQLASIEIQGNHAVIHNLRQCNYRAELDYTCQWTTRELDLSRIQGLDLFMDYWGSPWIAHTLLSFDFGGGQHVVFSIEQRKRPGQTYSSLRGFFRQYTLIAVVSDERDVIRLRTNYRHGEDVYLYHTRATPEFARSLFLSYADLANRLYGRPQWYNAITRNCSTEIYTLQAMKHQPRDWRILLNGKGDEMLYQQGELAGDLPFPELKRLAFINPAARAADQDPDFSVRIRENRPGFPTPAE
jgi:hypothetical protein